MKSVLLIQLGTPESPAKRSVRKYLREFLFDPQVIDLPWLARFILVYGIIAPFRAKKSSEAYKKIWTPFGSPLKVNTENLTKAVATRLGDNYFTTYAMRYGRPSMAETLDSIFQNKIEELIILPLYPQFALSSTQTALDEFYRALSKKKLSPAVRVIPPFFNQDGFIKTFARRGQNILEETKPDHILFSFHGLPERHVKKTEESPGHCKFNETCCAQYETGNPDCYRAQCFKTAQGIAQVLNLPESAYTICFQSRLGREPWLKPYTDLLLVQLAKQGCQRLAVFCPSFVADCLETLEEIEIRGRETFQSAGGKELFLVPSLNNGSDWAEVVADWVSNPSSDPSQRGGSFHSCT